MRGIREMPSPSVAYPQGTEGTYPPDVRPGDSHAKVHPLFGQSTTQYTVAGFTSQTLGLPAYACKTGSSTAIKLAPRMHQNLPF